MSSEPEAPVIGGDGGGQAIGDHDSAAPLDTTDHFPIDATPAVPADVDDAAGNVPIGETEAVPRPATPPVTPAKAPRKAPAKAPARTTAKRPVKPASASTPTVPTVPRKPATPRVPRQPAVKAIDAPPVQPVKAAIEAPVAPRNLAPVVLEITGLFKKFGLTAAVDGIDLEVHEGSFYGIVGPNGAGKTTLLSMATGLLRPDAGTIRVNGVDVWANPDEAKRLIGVLPDRLRLFDRLTGAQLLHYSGTLRGLGAKAVQARSDELAEAFGLTDALGRLVSDYSAGMSKKIALAASLIHSPRLLILDEPFESVDPVSAENLTEILRKFVAGGGTVVLSSHGMDMIQRVCDSVAIIVHGAVLDRGSIDEVRRTGTLKERFIELAGGETTSEGLEWLLSSSN